MPYSYPSNNPNFGNEVVRQTVIERIQDLMRALNISVTELSKFPNTETRSRVHRDEFIKEIENAIASNRKIMGIKWIRNHFPIGLKEAKMAYEYYDTHRELPDFIEEACLSQSPWVRKTAILDYLDLMARKHPETAEHDVVMQLDWFCRDLIEEPKTEEMKALFKGQK